MNLSGCVAMIIIVRICVTALECYVCRIIIARRIDLPGSQAMLETLDSDNRTDVAQNPCVNDRDIAQTQKRTSWFNHRSSSNNNSSY
jgi:hypothetical protein